MQTHLSSSSWQPSQPAILVGLDFGTNTSCMLASVEGSRDILIKKMVPTVVGYPKSTLLSGILPDNQSVFFGQEALQYKAHLDLVYPMQKGVVANMEAGKDFINHLHALIDPTRKACLKAIVGVPAAMSTQDYANMREVLSVAFSQTTLVPEPFLAALGYRNEKRLGEENYIDPVRNSLFVDIGAGTTDLCIIQGYIPGQKDLISLPFAGDWLDQAIVNAAKVHYPELNLPLTKARAIKEQLSYVSQPKEGLLYKVLVQGRPVELEFGPIVGETCNQLAEKVFNAILELIQPAHPDVVEAVLSNIVLTGGGSRIQGLGAYLQQRLQSEGFESPCVKTVGEHYKGFVAIGAWKGAVSEKLGSKM